MFCAWVVAYTNIEDQSKMWLCRHGNVHCYASDKLDEALLFHRPEAAVTARDQMGPDFHGLGNAKWYSRVHTVYFDEDNKIIAALPS